MFKHEKSLKIDFEHLLRAQEDGIEVKIHTSMSNHCAVHGEAVCNQFSKSYNETNIEFDIYLLS